MTGKRGARAQPRCAKVVARIFPLNTDPPHTTHPLWKILTLHLALIPVHRLIALHNQFDHF